MPDDVRSVEHRGKAGIRNGTGAGFVTADTLLAFRAALQAGLFSVLQCLRIANKRSPYPRERDVKQEKEKFPFLVRAVFLIFTVKTIFHDIFRSMYMSVKKSAKMHA